MVAIVVGIVFGYAIGYLIEDFKSKWAMVCAALVLGTTGYGIVPLIPHANNEGDFFRFVLAGCISAMVGVKLSMHSKLRQK